MIALKRIAGLFVFAHDAQGLFVLLQRRGEWDYERNQPESYPGGCQATASGGMEEEDDGDPYLAMLREVKQELGPTFHQIVAQARPEQVAIIPNPAMLREATYYWMVASEEEIRTIVLHPSTGGLVRFRQTMHIHDMSTEFTRADGITDRRIIAAYPEVKIALARAWLLTS